MLTYEESYVNAYISEMGGIPALTKAEDMLCDYVQYDEYYESKNKRLDEWNPSLGELHEVAIAVFTTTLLNDTLTYQAIVGMLCNRLALEDPVDRAKTMAEVIAVIGKAGLINIDRRGPGRSILVSTRFKLNKEIPDRNKHMPLRDKPPVVKKNMDDNLGNQILGGYIKFHEGEICLDHLNRMNAIELKLNKAFLCMHEEAPTFDLNTLQKDCQWKQYMHGTYDMYIKLARSGNRFWLDHKYDNRGRCYAVNYFVSTQGTSFKKAIVQLAKEELVKL